MRSKSIQGSTVGEIESALDVSAADGFDPKLAIVFIKVEEDVGAVCRLLTKRNIKIFGASAHSPFLGGDAEQGAIALLLLDLAPELFRIELVESTSSITRSVAEQIGKKGSEIFSKPSFLVVSGGLTADGDEIVDGIKSGAGKDVSLFGGLASDGLRMKRTFVFNNSQLTDHGLIALIINGDKIELSGLAYGGWEPVGNEKTITSSNANVVYTIDDQPALDFIARYSGINKDDLATASSMAILLSSNFQLQLQRTNKPPALRTPMHVNSADGSVVFAGAMPQGSRVRLCLLPSFKVIEITRNQFVEFHKTKPAADAVVMFSCAGRQAALGQYVNEEIDSIKEIWNVPMVGFFCYGEIGRVAGGQSEFFNMTCSLALLTEK